MPIGGLGENFKRYASVLHMTVARPFQPHEPVVLSNLAAGASSRWLEIPFQAASRSLRSPFGRWRASSSQTDAPARHSSVPAGVRGNEGWNPARHMAARSTRDRDASLVELQPIGIGAWTQAWPYSDTGR